MLSNIGRRIKDSSLNFKLVWLLATVSLICVITIASISAFRSSSAMEKQALDRLESMGQITKKRLEDFAKRSEIFTYNFSKDRLIEGLFLSYESAFYGGGFAPGKDLSIETSQYNKLEETYGERTRKMLADFNFGNIMLATVDSQVVLSVDKAKSPTYLGRNLLKGIYKDTTLSKCYSEAFASKDDSVIFSDFAFDPNLGGTTAFLCRKQYAEFDHLSEGIAVGDPMGVVITEVDMKFLNSIMTQRTGMGETGQAYIVGQDRKLRSDFFLDQEKFNVDASFKDGLTITSKAIEEVLQGKEGRQIVMDPTGNEVDSIHLGVNIFGKQWGLLAEQRVEEVLAPVRNLIYTVIIAAVILLISIVVASLFLAKLITRPVIHASAVLEEISKNVNERSSAMKSSSQSLSKGAGNLVQNVHNTVAILDELKATVAKNIEAVETSTRMGEKSQTAVDTGLSSVKSMINAMGKIKSSNEETVAIMNHIADKLREIIDVINKIGDKTKIINDIVFQTKLLSFNASVEAARAGEQGKGFAVVAEEVGNLAAASGSAADEISGMLSQSIQQVEAIVRDTTSKMDAISKDGRVAVSEGDQRAGQCGSALDEILLNVSEVNTRIQEIAVASRQQAESIENVSSSINELDAISSDTTSIAEETLHGSESLENGSSELNSVVINLNSMVHGNKGHQVTEVEEYEEYEDEAA